MTCDVECIDATVSNVSLRLLRSKFEYFGTSADHAEHTAYFVPFPRDTFVLCLRVAIGEVEMIPPRCVLALQFLGYHLSPSDVAHFDCIGNRLLTPNNTALCMDKVVGAEIELNNKGAWIQIGDIKYDVDETKKKQELRHLLWLLAEYEQHSAN